VSPPTTSNRDIAERTISWRKEPADTAPASSVGGRESKDVCRRSSLRLSCSILVILASDRPGPSLGYTERPDQPGVAGLLGSSDPRA
jgi:hypothetical protein